MAVTRAMMFLVLVSAWTAKRQPAHAENGVLVVGGGAAYNKRTVVRRAIESAVRNVGWSLPNITMTSAEKQALLACPHSDAPWTCVPRSVSLKTVDRVFVIEVNNGKAPDGTRMIVLTGKLIVISPPLSSTVRQRYCSPCANANLVTTSEDLAKQLIDPPLGPSPITSVSITTLPPDAQITLDGTKVGTAGQTLPTSPGKHSVTVEKPGFLPETNEVVVNTGQNTEIFFTLRILPPPMPMPMPPLPPLPPPPSPRPWPILPAASIAAGTALLVFSSISLYHGQQGGPDDRYRYTRATPVGVVTGLVGLGAVGTGIYLLWRRSAESGPMTSVQHGGAVVGWRGQF